MEAESLYRLKFVSDCQISSLGEVTFVLTTIEDEENKKKYRSNIWLWREGSDAFPFTNNQGTSPRFSPDGKTLVFLSDRQGKSQIYLISTLIGEAQVITNLKSGVSDPLWSPDGQKIAFLSRGDWENEPDEPKIIENLIFKADGSGMLADEYRNLWIINADGSGLQKITDETSNIAGFNWLSDGSGFVYFAQDLNKPASSKINLVKINGENQEIINWPRLIERISISPDGLKVALTAYSREYIDDVHLYLLDLRDDRPNTPIRIDKNIDFTCFNWISSDSRFGNYPDAPIWLSNESVLALYTVEGESKLIKIGLDGTAEELVGERNSSICAFHLLSAEKIVYIKENIFSLPEVYLQKDNKTLNISKINEETVSILKKDDIEYIRFDNEGFIIESWVLKPADWQANKKYPVILYIHGGPQATYGHGYMHEFHWLASLGFAVVFGNIRGSSGYGEKHLQGVQDSFGQGDYSDIMALFNKAIECYPWLDDSRAGIIGGSYGGFMTSWTISHNDHFKAAVAERGVYNWLSFYGASDVGVSFCQKNFSADLPSDADKLWDISPLKYADNIKIPTLIIHYSGDQRCPIEQAEQFYVALKKQGVETKFAYFPGNDHGMSRIGKPEHRVFRLKTIADWFKKYL